MGATSRSSFTVSAAASSAFKARRCSAWMPVSVLAEARLVPGPIIDAEPDKPAEQEVELQPLHEQPFRAKAVKGLQEQRPHKPLGRDRRSAGAGGVERVELRAEAAERRIDDRPDRSQRVVGPYPRLQVDIREQ